MSKTIFSHLFRATERPTPADLFDRVMAAIQRARLRQAGSRFAIALVGFLASIGYAILNWSTIAAEIQASPFFGFVRLAISDPDIVFANGKDFLFGLLEALPLGTVLLVLLGIFFFISTAVMTDALRHARRAPSPRVTSA